MPMDKIYSSENLNNIEKTTILENKKNTNIDESNIQPSEQAIETILNYSKSICVLNSKNSNKKQICNIN